MFDLGAGTCDIYILEVKNNEEKIQISSLSISRDGEVGGDQIDFLIAERILLRSSSRLNRLKFRLNTHSQ